MAAGNDVAVILPNLHISTQAAADYLGMSRPHIVKLLEKGEMPHTKVGAHRRVEFKALLAYQEKLKKRATNLESLANQAQTLNLGYK